MTVSIAVMHRAELLAVLASELSPEPVHLDHECLGFVQDGGGVTARFKNGKVVRGDVLIGADGLHSVIRAQLFGNSPPRYAGYTAWRAVVRIAHPQIVPCESWGRGRRFGILPFGDGRVYWYATKNSAEGGRDSPGQAKQHLLRLFRGWHDPVEALIEATDESAILRNDIYDREPLQRWSENRVTLLGDAAHPMTPDLGQGGCQAIEDAVVLAPPHAADERACATVAAHRSDGSVGEPALMLRAQCGRSRRSESYESSPDRVRGCLRGTHRARARVLRQAEVAVNERKLSIQRVRGGHSRCTRSGLLDRLALPGSTSGLPVTHRSALSLHRGATLTRYRSEHESLSPSEPGPLPRKEYKWQDSDPVSIRLSLLMMNDIVLAGVSGEVMTMIHEHLKKESPFKDTVMVTHANGSSGYIPDDAAFDQVSYEITTSRLKLGCAENAIVNSFLRLMEQR